MLGGLISSGLKIAGGIAGGIAGAKAMKKVKKNINEQRQENQDWYDQRYNEDATQRGDAQRMITMATQQMMSANRRAAGAQAVMGGSEESVAAAKAAANQSLADATASITAAADARKDTIEQQYRSTDSALAGQLNALEQQRAAGIGSAIQDVASAAGGIANAFGEKYGL